MDNWLRVLLIMWLRTNALAKGQPLRQYTKSTDGFIPIGLMESQSDTNLSGITA